MDYSGHELIAKDTVPFMEVIIVRIERKFYEFDCPSCHHALRADPSDLKFGKITIGFTCPVCKKEQKVLKFQVTSTTVRTYNS